LRKKVFSQISVIVVLSILIGILYNNSSMNPLPLIRESSEDFSQSDSLMIIMLKQDSILKAADSLKMLSLKSEDSLRLVNEQRIKDSLDHVFKLDSMKHVSDSLKAQKKHIEDSLKSANQKKDTTSASSVKPIDIKLDFAKLMYDKKYIFVDARDEKDFNEGHIQGAVNVPYHNLEQYKSRLNQFSKSQVLVIYCSAGCDVSIDLAYALVKEGFSKLYIFRGGWDEWKSAGYPVN
jgi:rhodanese-related sulfurtransferase